MARLHVTLEDLLKEVCLPLVVDSSHELHEQLRALGVHVHRAAGATGDENRAVDLDGVDRAQDVELRADATLIALIVVALAAVMIVMPPLQHRMAERQAQRGGAAPSSPPAVSR